MVAALDRLFSPAPRELRRPSPSSRRAPWRALALGRSARLAVKSREAASFRDRAGVPRAVQHADKNEFRFGRRVIDGVSALENYTQARREILPRRTRKRKLQQSLARVLDLGKQARGGRFRGFGSDIDPDFGKVGFRRVG